MMTQQKVFPATASARHTISRRAYLMFAAGVGLISVAAIAAGVIFATGRASVLPVAIAGGVGCAGMAGLIVGIVTLSRLKESIQVIVTPYRLTWQEGSRTAALEFEEVVRVDLVKDVEVKSSGRTLTFPVVRFIENDGEMMEFEVTFEDRGMLHQGRFDAYAITAAVLPNLPQHAIISPTLEDFLQTGEVDIDLLPDR